MPDPSWLGETKAFRGAKDAKQQRDPWLIAPNLSPTQFSPKKIMTLYGKRMQIEAGFRDLKSDQFGFGLTLSRSATSTDSIPYC